MTGRPDRSEAADYYFTYIDKVPGDDILAVLQAQLPETLSMLEGISEDRSRHRYAEGKWSIREMVGHVNDCERLFAFRAFWFARGFDSPLPSFDQDVAVPLSGSEARTLRDHIEEFRLLRGATLALLARHSPSSRRCPPRRGRGAASRATGRSRCARWRSLPRGTSRTTSRSCGSAISS